MKLKENFCKIAKKKTSMPYKVVQPDHSGYLLVKGMKSISLARSIKNQINRINFKLD